MTEYRSRRALLRAAMLALAVVATASADAGPRHGERDGRDGRGQEDRARLQRREQGFRSLPRDEQQRVREAEDRYRSMSPEQREELRQRWRSMSESERDRYRRRVERNAD
ncbi:MAG: hypothetical protein CALGDGBN_02265 [Pseudomonadales bacterium]|nr:hypothetical protein [Pseudomonadales bacterium]